MSSADAPPAGIREFHHREFSIERIIASKGTTSASVCLPARNEAETVGPIVETLKRELLDTGAIDEIVVIDDHSTDETGAVAARAGARVVHSADVLARYGTGHGKGEVLWKSLFVTDSDLIVWCDSDISEFGSRFVTGILGALLCEPDVDLAKGFYRRPEREREGGGRVTELVARPLLSMFFPELARLHQPLSGEYGGRRSVLEQLPFVEGYGVEVGLLIDLADRFGLSGLVQVDLEVRHHRNRSLTQLSPQAVAIAQTILKRVEPGLVADATTFLTPGKAPITVELSERPPMVDVSAYRGRGSHLSAVES
ncbi:MAG: glucosyl-3-phosphoglycerate synthase [Microthrixaceae bacterium]